MTSLPNTAKPKRDEYIITAYQKRVPYYIVRDLMDQGIMRWVDAMCFNGAKVAPQRFYNAYCVHHQLKTGEIFVPNRKDWDV